MVYSHYRTFTQRNFRGYFWASLNPFHISTVVFFFFFSTCTLSSSLKHYSINLSVLMTWAWISRLKSFFILMTLWLWYLHPSSAIKWYLQLSPSELCDFFLSDIYKSYELISTADLPRFWDKAGCGRSFFGKPAGPVQGPHIQCLLTLTLSPCSLAAEHYTSLYTNLSHPVAYSLLHSNICAVSGILEPYLCPGYQHGIQHPTVYLDMRTC